MTATSSPAEPPESTPPADGFCPACASLADEACHHPDGSPCEDHKARHPYPSQDRA